MQRSLADSKQAEQWLISAMKSDVDSLLGEFMESDSSRFQTFARIFNDKEFSTIFLGRLSAADLVEFSENLIKYVASFMFVRELDYKPSFAPENSRNRAFEMSKMKQKTERQTLERLFGIYATYCLYFLQPAQYVSSVRLSAAQMRSLKNFMDNVLLPEQYYDALFCLFRLTDNNAFTIVPFEQEFNPLLSRKFDFDEVGPVSSSSVEQLEKMEDFGLLKSLCSDFALKQTDMVHDRYLAEKAQLNLPTSVRLLTQSIKNYTESFVVQTESTFQRELESAQSSKTTSTFTSRARVRDKAMAATSSQPRHRRHRLLTSSSDMPQTPEDEAAVFAVPSPTKRRRRKSVATDPVQQQILKSVHAEQKKSTRIRRETLTTGEELSESDLIHKEVEMEVNKRTKSTEKPAKQRRTRQKGSMASSAEEPAPSTSVPPGPTADVSKQPARGRRSTAGNTSKESQKPSGQAGARSAASLVTLDEAREVQAVDELFAKLSQNAHT